MKTFAFIFARGGSKGLPGKNIKMLLGKPLIAHSIDFAKSMPEIDRIFVSTDSEEIADVAKMYGAEVPFIRPEELASDNAAEWKAWQHAVDFVQTEVGTFDRFISLPATAPCREIKDVRGAMNLLQEDVDMVVTASKSGHHPYFNILKVDSMGLTSKFIDVGPVNRRQDVDQAYNISTVAYVTRPEFILANNGLWDGKVKTQVVDLLNGVDIDIASEFKLAELILEDRLARQL